MAQIYILFLLDSVELLFIDVNGVECSLERWSVMKGGMLNILKTIEHTCLYVILCQRGLHFTSNSPYFLLLQPTQE
jgi:hypothetical protein